MFSNLLLFITFAIFFFTHPTHSAPNVFVDFTKLQWYLHGKNPTNGQRIEVATTLPMTVHTTLFNNGIIPDPYNGFNDVAQQWIATKDWSLTAVFNVTNIPSSLSFVAEGLDSYATVLLNGYNLGYANNQFRTWVWAIPGHIVTPSNQITIKFHSNVNQAKIAFQNYVPPPGAQQYGLVPQCPPSVQNGFCYFNYIRKESSSFSWDWGPGFATMGVYRGLYLADTTLPTINSLLVSTSVISFSRFTWNLNINVLLDSQYLSTMPITVRATINPVVCSYVQNFSSPLPLNVPIYMVCTGVQPWNPIGYGSPNLYNLTITISSNGQSIQKSVRTGFRVIQLVQEKVPGTPDGLSFYFNVNSIPIFLKGANWIPADSFDDRVTRDTIRSLFDSFKMANFNTIRNWGGGNYQPDMFYELADEYGFLVWNEFKFACATYSNDTTFLDNVRAEVADNVQRLQHHPSLLLWGGSNENEALVSENWYAPTRHNATYYGMYSDLYYNTVLDELSKYDTQIPRVASSPSNGWETAQNPIADDPQDPRYGDVHYYNYGADCWNVSYYPRPRFASEYGFQSFPSLITMLPATGNGTKDLAWDSAFMFHRQHHQGGLDQIKAFIVSRYPSPNFNSTTKNDVKLTLFMSQVYHAMCLKTESEHYRRLRDQSNVGTYNMGALFWQANDIWQAPTWSTLEFGGRWKVAHNYARKFFAELLISMWFIQDSCGISVVYDGLSLLTGGNVTTTVWSTDKTAPNGQTSFPFPTMLSNDAQQVYSGSLTSLLNSAGGCANRDACFILLDAPGKTTSSNFIFLGNLTHAPLLNPQLKVISVTASSGNTFSVTYNAQQVALFTWLETSYVGWFDDNGGITVPGASKTVTFTATGKTIPTAAQLQSSLDIYSLYDVKASSTQKEN